MKSTFLLLLALAGIEPLCGIQSLPPDQSTQKTELTAQQLCHRLSEVRELPFKDESVDDPVFNGLMAAGKAAVPCLLTEVSNTRSTYDPRKAPHYSGVTVGDVAFWILGRIVQLPYEDIFPPEVSKRFAEEGVYAYFDWIKKGNHRRMLQQNIRSYLSRRDGKKALAKKPAAEK